MIIERGWRRGGIGGGGIKSDKTVQELKNKKTKNKNSKRRKREQMVWKETNEIIIK